MSKIALKLIAENKAARVRGEAATYLDLGNCGLTQVPEEIGELVWLEELVLSNEWDEYDFEKKEWITKQSKILGKKNRLISLPQTLTQLVELKKLIAAGEFGGRWAPSDLSPLSGLKKLKQLNCSYTQVTDLSPLSGLKNLQILSCSSTLVSDLSPLSKLENLQILSSFSTPITDLSPLSGLKDLQILSCSSTQVSSLSPLAELKNLRQLFCYSTQITDLSPLAMQENLEVLYCANTLIQELSPLAGLKNLKQLYCFNTKIKDLSPLSELENLQLLNCGTTQVTDLFPILPFIKNGIKITWKNGASKGTFDFKDCPLTNPPPEIVKQGNKAILNYFRERERSGIERVLEAKMLILGEGGAGKTSLLRRLKDQPLPGETDSTHGIDIQNYSFQTKRGETFKINIWDFGGQEIYHATHQFFLTKRSLYILVTDVRKQDTDFNYWLQLIELLAGDSPVIIFQNEKGGRTKEINRQGLLARFGENIRKFEAFDLKENDSGFERLRREIEHQVQQLTHVQQELPKTWARVRRDVETLKIENKSFITDREFFEICGQHEVEGEGAIFLSAYLHDLGVFLHFQDDPILKRWVFLENEWVTTGVYTILDNPLIISQKGRFKKSVAAGIWSEKHYRHMYDELLQLMLKFELCYRIPDLPDEAEYLAPQLLGANQPTLDWNETGNLQLQYQYEFMPKGLLSRLIVRLHRYIRDTENEAWRTGVVLHHQNTKAKLEETYGTRNLHLRVNGPQAKELLTIIAEEIDRLNGTFPSLRVQKRVPCICSECRKSEDPYFHTYEKIQRARERGRPTVECERSFEDVDVLRLIDNVFATTFFYLSPKKIFISYSKADKEHLDILKTHLSTLKQSGALLTWDDNDLIPGEEWDKSILRQLIGADIIILLVSPDFLATDYIWSNELKMAMDRHVQGEISVVPVIIRPCLWEETPFAKLNALPEKGKPVTKWANRDEAWLAVAEGIKKCMERLTRS